MGVIQRWSVGRQQGWIFSHERLVGHGVHHNRIRFQSVDVPRPPHSAPPPLTLLSHTSVRFSVRETARGVLYATDVTGVDGTPLPDPPPTTRQALLASAKLCESARESLGLQGSHGESTAATTGQPACKGAALHAGSSAAETAEIDCSSDRNQAPKARTRHTTERGATRDIRAPRRPLREDEWDTVLGKAAARPPYQPFALDLRKTELSSNVQALDSVTALLRADETAIDRLYLFQCRLGDADGKPLLQIASAAAESRWLAELVLCNNNIDAAMARSLGTLLRSSKLLRLLDLNNNVIGSEGAETLAQTLLATGGPPLRHMSMWNCGVGTEGAGGWVDAVRSAADRGHRMDKVNLGPGGDTTNTVEAKVLAELAALCRPDESDSEEDCISLALT